MIRKPKLSGDGLPSSERATLTNELLMELIDEIKSIKEIFTPDNIILPDPKLEIVKPEPIENDILRKNWLEYVERLEKSQACFSKTEISGESKEEKIKLKKKRGKKHDK